jgi:hypothetical protein
MVDIAEKRTLDDERNTHGHEVMSLMMNEHERDANEHERRLDVKRKEKVVIALHCFA